jgi:hypothetical protein
VEVCSILHGPELHNFFSSPNVITVAETGRMRGGARDCTRYTDTKLYTTYEGKRPFLKPRHKWEDVIKKDRKGIEHESVDWIHVAVDSVQWRSLLYSRIISFSSRPLLLRASCCTFIPSQF